ncbi:MAG: hypothetical protein HXX09_01495 [Bacteroidetes bacterium]|nr:hypothetical protein [Bacteroidota bacterium]
MKKKIILTIVFIFPFFVCFSQTAVSMGRNVKLDTIPNSNSNCIKEKVSKAVSNDKNAKIITTTNSDNNPKNNNNYVKPDLMLKKEE